MQMEERVAIIVQASMFGLQHSYPSTVLLQGYERCQSYSSTLIPAFAHSIAYTGLSSINTFAPSSLQHPPTVFLIKVTAEAQAWLPATCKNMQAALLMASPYQERPEASFDEVLRRSQSWRHTSLLRCLLAIKPTPGLFQVSHLQISDLGFDLPSSAQWFPKCTS